MLIHCRLSPMFQREAHGLFGDLYELLQRYTYFPIEDHSGKPIPDPLETHSAIISKLQRTAIKHFPTQLKVLALSNYASLGSRSDLASHLESLNQEEIVRLCSLLGIRTEYPPTCSLVRDHAFLIEVLVSFHEKRPSYLDSMREMALLPTEKLLYDPTLLRNEEYNGSRPLALPKLNLQYLTIGDFLWRSFILHRCESFYEIKKDLEDTVKRLRPETRNGTVDFKGFSRMARPISKPAILEVAPPNVGEIVPASVRVEIILDVNRLKPPVRMEWDSLRPGDVVFLLSVRPAEDGMMLTNGHSISEAADRLGLRSVRCAEVIQVQDEKGKPLREQAINGQDGHMRSPRQRRLILKLDPTAFHNDTMQASKSKGDFYESFNLIVRRRGRENNFKAILESIRKLTLSDTPAPKWLQDVLLGYSDGANATYKKLPNRLRSIDFRDTFLDWQHLIQSLTGKTVEPALRHTSLGSQNHSPRLKKYRNDRQRSDAEMTTTHLNRSSRRSGYRLTSLLTLAHIQPTYQKSILYVSRQHKSRPLPLDLSQV